MQDGNIVLPITAAPVCWPSIAMPPSGIARGWVSGIEWRDAVAAKFVLKKGSTGKFHFNRIATNGQVIATSEAYESKAAALNGIESVKKNAPLAEVDDQST
jgi:uncharacterized protein YegP (UPF0339 family)